MTLRNLAVHVDHRRERVQGEALAVELAAHCGAHLTGVFVDPVPLMPELVGMSAAPELLQAVYDESENRAREAQAAFEARAEGAGVTVGFRRGEGPMYVAIAEQARCCDLLVMTQEGDGGSGPVLGGLPEHAVMASGRPVLVVPSIGAPVPVEGTALVAWSGTRESARAVNDALGLLALAARVEVVVVSDASSEGEMPGADLAEHLARHDLAVDLKVLPYAGLDAHDRVLSHAADVEANLIVMGAYGHSRLRETVLGGMTRDMLTQMTVPVLMSH